MHSRQKTESPERYILDRIKVDPNGCWVWQRVLGGKGYGHYMRRDDLRGSAHRASYLTFVGPIPEGMHLDHLCRNRACCNPQHLEPVTLGENVRRGRDSRLGRDFTLFQRKNGLWVATVTTNSKPRKRKSFTSLDRDSAVKKLKDWVRAGGQVVPRDSLG